MLGTGEVPVPQPRISLLNGLSKSTSHIYENLAPMSSQRGTAIPMLKRPQNSSFLHSTYHKSTVDRQKHQSKVTSTTSVRTSLKQTATLTCEAAQNKEEIPPQMVATLTGQFNALIERRKAEQLQLSGLKKQQPIETSPTVRSCPSSPQPIAAFTRGKWSSVGHTPTNRPTTKPPIKSYDSCDSALQQLKSRSAEQQNLTAVQRAARNYEVALKKTTSAISISSTTTTSGCSSISLSAVETTKVQNGIKKVDILKTKRPKIKPPEVPKFECRPEVPNRDTNSSPLDLLAEIDRHMKVKEQNGVKTEPNSSFLWKKSTQRRFHVKAEVKVDVQRVEGGEEEAEGEEDEEEHLYEELSNFFSTSSSKNGPSEVPLAVAEHDSSSSSCGSTSSYGYTTATSLAYSLARSSIKSNGSVASSNGHKEKHSGCGGESDGGSWADDSDDESHPQSQRWRVSRCSWNKSKGLVDVGGSVNSAGESLWEDDIMENIYTEPIADEGGGGKGRKKVKRNWSWSKTRTEFHLDIGSKLNRKWPFKGGSDVSKISNRKSTSPTDKNKEANAQFYIPSTSSSTSSSSATDAQNRTKRPTSRPTAAPPAPPVKSLSKDDDDSSTGISSQSCESVVKEPEEEPKRFLYLDDTYYIDGDEKKLSPFDNEPLYQFYTMAAQQRLAHENQMDSSDDDCYESLYDVRSDAAADDDVKATDCNEERLSTNKVPSAMELVRLTEGGVRTLWCEVPEVEASGVLSSITHAQRNVQEAMFEVITSEASYLKSLNILINHFMLCPMFLHNEFSSECVLSKRERHVLFSDVLPVRETSERLLEALEQRWQENIIIKDICDIVLQHATKYFNVYVKYCSNQLYQDRCLKKLKESNSEFVEVLRRLESNSVCQGLTMYSFLLLPMQRITRLPLLLDAIFQRLDVDNPIYDNCKQALATLNKVNLRLIV
ncbi:hypothetical protein CHUAL_000694 [Chamberlinius hualienensis]